MHYLESSTCGISSLYIYINEWLGMTSVSLDIHHVTHNHQCCMGSKQMIIMKVVFSRMKL